MSAVSRIFLAVAAGFFVMWFTAGAIHNAVTGSPVATNTEAIIWISGTWWVASAAIWGLSMLVWKRK